MTLPPLRQELALHTGPRQSDGHPSWTVQDPVRNLFFRLDWLTFEILVNWRLGDSQRIADSIRMQTPLDVQPGDVDSVLEFLLANQLVKPQGPDDSALLARQARARRRSWWTWLVHNYLFFRMPIAHPDRWLSAMLKRTTMFYSSGFIGLTLAAFAIGVMLISRQWDVFRATLVDQFTVAGLANYAVAIVFVKLLHELGHALTARRFGCHVPTMGVALIVLWPMAYTDVNEAWKLADRRSRLLISSAGVLTEFVLAIWATLAWGLLEDGFLRSIAFLLATTTWVSTVFINLSPFMRFDGYFVLSDLIDVANLHMRAFALARWKLREWLFDFGEEPPEYFSKRRAAGLIFFAWFTWIYRLVIFAGIALLVYSFFVKAIGIVLFLIEIVWFILMPIYAELKTWRSRLTEILRSQRTAMWLLVLAALTLVILTPLPWTIRAASLLHSGEEYAVYAPEGAKIEVVHANDNELVSASAPLFTLSSNLLNERLLAARSRVERLAAQVDSAAVNASLRNRLLSLQADLRAARSSLHAIELQLREHRPVAPRGGRFRLADPDLRPGVWVARNERLATIIDGTRWHAEAYVTERDVHRLEEGTRALFYHEGRIHSPIEMTLTSIARDATRVLAEGALAHSNGGSVTARDFEGKFIPEHAVFRLTFEVNERPVVLEGQTWRGTVSLRGQRESIGVRAGRAAMAVVWREAGW